MLEIISKLSVSGGIGFLIGLLLVWWIDPNTGGGIALIIFVCIVLAVVVDQLVVSRFK
jgi:hypothetical protein